MTRQAAEVVVVGGGPAGAVLAGILARAGRDVLVLDRSRFPRPKPCGESLNPDAVRRLSDLGILGAVEAREPALVEGWSLCGPGGARSRGAFGGDRRYGLALARRELDTTLLAWARLGGARVLEGVRVREVEPGGPRAPARVRSRNGAGAWTEWSAPVVVGADGLRSVVARSSGLVARKPRLHKLSLTRHLEGTGPDPSRGHLFFGRRSVLGLAPLTPLGNRWNATVVVNARREGRDAAGNPAEFHRSLVSSFPVPWSEPPRPAGGPWASGPFDWPSRGVARGRVLLVGDAAGYYDPLTGQGIRRALASATEGAAAIQAALEDDGGASAHLAEYGRRWKRQIAPGRRVQRVIEHVVSQPVLLEAFLRRAGTDGEALSALLRVTGDLAPARSLFRPSVWMPLLRPPRLDFKRRKCSE